MRKTENVVPRHTSRVDFSTRIVEIPSLEQYSTQTVATGEILYLQGRPAEFFIILRGGRALTKWQSETTNRSVCELFRAPSVLGTEALIGVESYQSYQREAFALDTCIIQYIPRQDFYYLPQNIKNRLLLTEVVRSHKMKQLMQAKTMGVEAAIAFVLLDLAEGDQHEIKGIHQQTIANMAGISRRWVSITMSEFQKQGIISGVEQHIGGGRRNFHRLPQAWFLVQPDVLDFIADGGISSYKNASHNPQA